MAYVDLKAHIAILLPGIFGTYVMEEPRRVHNLFTFEIPQSGGIAVAQPRFLPNDVKLILKWGVMEGQADGQGKSLLNLKIKWFSGRRFSICRSGTGTKKNNGSVKGVWYSRLLG